MSDRHVPRIHHVTTDNATGNPAALEQPTDSGHPGSSEPVPEADLLEQLTPVDPGADRAVTTVSGGPTPGAGQNASRPSGPVDEADWLEQQLTVPAEADEDYPNDLNGLE